MAIRGIVVGDRAIIIDVHIVLALFFNFHAVCRQTDSVRL